MWTLSSTALLTLLLAPFPALDPSSDDRLLVWGTVLGLGFLFRASARGLWRRITPPQRVLIVGEGPLAQAVVRKLELFPDIHAEITSRIPSCAELHAPLHEVVDDVDRVVIACSELNEALLEELLPVCRARHVKLTIVPPTRGMFGTATHLTHIADLPLLDYNTWYISNSTLALKRVFDLVVGDDRPRRHAADLRARPRWRSSWTTAARSSSASSVSARADAGSGCSSSGRWCATPRRGSKTSSRSTELDDPMFKLKADPRVTRVGTLPAADEHRRAATAPQRPQG